MRTIVPPLNDANRDENEYLLKVLETLRLSFKIDTSEAENLHGQELADWVEKTEKQLLSDLQKKP
jgi:hypothetical protein